VRVLVVTEEEPSRSPMAVGVVWASRVMSVAMEFALPPLAGVYLDRRWATQPILTLVGSALGFAVGMVHILKIAREGTRT
jgi:ATP synthase protein I